MKRQASEKRPTIFIAGGGIAGLTTALALQRAGLEVKVFEQAQTNHEVGAGVALWSNATYVLAHLGLTDLLHTVGAPITSVVRYTPDGRVMSAFSLEAIERTVGIGSFAVHRAELHRGLFEALADDIVVWSARCMRFQQHEDGMTVQLADGREFRGDLLIGADGIHSTIRSQLLGLWPLRYAGYCAIRGIVSFDHPFLSSGKLFETWGPDLQFGAVKLGGGRVYWYLQLNGPADSPRREKAALLALCKGFHKPVEDLIAATEESALLQHDVYYSNSLPYWGKGAVTLVGDAAHPLPPTLAQGACQAIEDAGVLSLCLREQPDIQGLRNYERLRRGRATRIAQQSVQIGQIEQWETPPLSWLRDLLLLKLPHPLQERLMEPIFGYKLPL